MLESVTVLDGDELDEDLLARRAHEPRRRPHVAAPRGRRVLPQGHRRCRAPAPSAVPSSTSTAGRSPGSSTPTTPRSRRSTPTTPAPTRSPLYATPPGSVEVPDRALAAGHVHVGRRHRGARCSSSRRRRHPTGPGPPILYGYGGFGVPMSPGYSAAILAWVEAGGVWAVANIRGGGEEGEEWHRDGMLGQQAERVRRLPRAPRSSSSPRAGRRRSSSGSTADRTAACSSARR